VCRGSKTITFLVCWTRFAYSLCNFGGSTMKVINVICENNARPVLKDVWDSAHARNHVICLRWPKCFIAVVLADVDLLYWTLKVEHIVSFTAIFSNICTAQAQKRLFMDFRCKFRHRRSIRRPRFPVGVQNFGDLATFSVDFCILYAEYPPYFYFRYIWLTDLESTPNASTPTLIIPTKFVVDMTIHCRVTAFLSADKSRDLVTLTFVLLTLNGCHTWWVTWPTLPPSLKTLRVFVHELRVITVPIDYHRKCVLGHCACAESRDPWVGGQKRLHIWNPRPRFAYSL